MNLRNTQDSSSSSFLDRVTKNLLYLLKDHLLPSTFKVVQVNEFVICVVFRDLLEIN